MSGAQTASGPQLAAESCYRADFARPAGRAWVRVGAAASEASVYVNGQLVGTHLGAWTPFEFEITRWLRDQNELEIRCRDCLHTTNGFLPTLGVRWTGARDVEIRTAPTPPRAPARQRSAVRGTQLLVDGQSFRVRGVLHWGYYPELKQPWPAEGQMRREIRDMQSLGFNLIKFCLWVPPPRYYELCDELGMLVWQEYPVWNAPLADRAIIAEYEEFFRQDGPHACVILRTLACENDRIAPELGRELVDLAHRMILGCVALDNSGWLCSERAGDFHDEHPYLHNAQWSYYARRLRGKLTKPLLLGETMAVDTLEEGSGFRVQGSREEPLSIQHSGLRTEWERLRRASRNTALAVRRFQVETLARDLPAAGYVITGIRDTQDTPIGLYAYDGQLKYRPDEWAWHRDCPAAPRAIPQVSGPIIGPRKGEWKCPEYLWWSPVVQVLDPALRRELIERECVFDLLSGRVLAQTEGTRVLVEVWDVHSGAPRRHPLVIEFESEGQRRVVSAFRHDTAAGRELWEILSVRTGPAPEIGPLIGTSIVLEDWEMSFDETHWTPIKCDTPLVNGGANVFEGWATFRTPVNYLGGPRILRCEAVGDYYEVFIDGQRLGEAGPREGTWDGTRDIPRNFDISLSPGAHEFVFRLRDWRAAGGLVGPVYLTTNLDERIF
ncbi:MAG TPA: hypothetical protein VGM03_07980 [Phycisphaerae bacterium]